MASNQETMASNQETMASNQGTSGSSLRDPVRNILKEFSLNELDLDKATDDTVFLSLGLNFDYFLGIHLGLSKSDITAIKKDNDSDQDRVIALFWKWQERKGSGATYLLLLKVLIEIENKEAAEKLCQYYRDKHQKSSAPRFKSQLSHPPPAINPSRSYYRRSASDPVDTQKRVRICEKNPSNKAWKIFDRYSDQMVDVLRKDANLCDSMLELLADNFLIGSTEQDVIQQLSNFNIKSKAMMGHVSTFISQARNPIRAFAKFVFLIRDFKNFDKLFDKIKAEASLVAIFIPIRSIKTAKLPSLAANKEFSFKFSDDTTNSDDLILPVKQYSRHLKALYKKEKPDPKWSFTTTPSKVYVDLAVVNKKSCSDSFSKSTIRGTADDIFLHKEPFSLEELCRIEYGEAVLIEGAPGIGKSMLAFEICSRWIKGEALKKYPLLLLLRLRDKFIQNCKTVKDLLGCFLKEQSWKEEAVQHIFDKSGEGLIVILEGFDELPEDLTQASSVFLQISEELPFTSLIYTSRPSAKHSLKQEISFSRHIEVLGFTGKSINEYIQLFFENDNECIATLNQHLDESPKVRSCLYIPVHLVIICSIFQQYIMNKEQVPFKGIVTSTKLYEAMIKMLLYRHIKSKNPAQLVSIDLNDLPDSYQKDFSFLCEMAYIGFRKRATDLIFYLDSHIETLGMMQKEVQVYPGTGDVIAYSFLHPTIQEFLAAYHIFRMPKDEIEDIFNRLKNVMKFSTMLCFLSGLTELQSITPSVDNHLYSMTLFRCLYESGNHSLIASLFSEKDKVYKVRRLLPRPSPQDMFILGKCIALSSCQWGLSFTLRGITFEHLEKFRRGLISIESNPSCKIEDISFSLNPIGDEGMMELIHFPEHILKNLDSLRLMSCEFHSCAAIEFSKQLRKFSSLGNLFFHNNFLKEGEQLCLIEAMIPLKCFHVTFSKLSPDECAVLLTKVSSIGKVYLYQLGSSSIEKVIECFPKSLSLEVLHIEQSCCTPENLSLLPTTLPSSTLTKLELVNCAIDSSSVRTIIDAVLMSHHLEALNLSYNFIDDEGGAHLCSMLRQLFGSSEEPATDSNSSCSFKKFKFLDIGHNPFTGHGISSFIDELAHFKSDSTNFILSLSLGWKDQVCEHVSFTVAQQHLKFESNEND
ncbi:PREDICTED: NACHT, LRR and PYD domains-containing protein 3-like isoform X2 [Amphimedon queenslandica]|uniref:NACHT domain-containing protein n=1 Tax=Amphimedon queenslandica TaxID=400682 RepID=A0AAN0JI74_AMPQE|nr:PREDICTED: NACHT, LRR and PYD domains-containing protein 3-like isoform X2 [Amphimedon queenslandica]|eukprot:XP_019856353.1 PREDICTED: NACHT, LRR and PYD domains-containing protein 3-like isoform X2 [Amphimedon queenslandica]